MDIEALHMFVDIARMRSLSAVARARDVDPSSISRVLAALEEELGARLFERTTRNMALTEVGEAYLSRVAPLLEEFESARDAVNSHPGDPTGTLRMTASVSFGHHLLVPLLPTFREAFPNLQLELILTDTNVDLLAERIDLAVRLGSTYRGDVIGTKLMQTHFRVVASPDYLDRCGTPETPTNLADHSCLLFALPDYRSRWLFRSDGQVLEVPVQGDLLTTSAMALRDMARAGLGPTLLADWLIADDLMRGTLIDLFPTYEVTATTFDTAAWLLYPSRQYLPNKVRATIDFLRRFLNSAS